MTVLQSERDEVIMNNGKETVSFETTTEKAQQHHVRARQLGMSRSEFYRRAADEKMEHTSCPLCGGYTTKHPDPLMTGVRWCPKCQESVGFQVLAPAQ